MGQGAGEHCDKVGGWVQEGLWGSWEMQRSGWLQGHWGKSGVGAHPECGGGDAASASTMARGSRSVGPGLGYQLVLDSGANVNGACFVYSGLYA